MPIFLFATLFGVSMDYEVFLVSRMREAWDAGATNERAVALGLERIGRIVTAAALVMVAGVLGLRRGPRSRAAAARGRARARRRSSTRRSSAPLLVPALMAVLGRWNWWLPAGLARVLRVEALAAPSSRPDPVTPETARAACAALAVRGRHVVRYATTLIARRIAPSS